MRAANEVGLRTMYVHPNFGTRRLRRLVFYVLLSSFSLIAHVNGDSVAKVDRMLSDVEWSEHWAGPKVKGSDVTEGKVTLVVLWGG